MQDKEMPLTKELIESRTGLTFLRAKLGMYRLNSRLSYEGMGSFSRIAPATLFRFETAKTDPHIGTARKILAFLTKVDARKNRKVA